MRWDVFRVIVKDKDMGKRAADMLEKFGIASLAIGLYQMNWIALCLGTVSIFSSFFITWRIR